MKIIIAPAKIMKNKQLNIKQTDLLFPNKTAYLHQYLQNFSVENLHDTMKISFKMAQTVYDYYHNDDIKTTPALFCYQGTVLKQLNLQTYDESDFNYLDKYLTILSAYYGILKYNTGITPYRLDMTMKLNIDLYQYWQQEVDDYFKNEDYLISLASNEFVKMVNHPNIINLDFVEDRGGKLTRNSMYVKQARGKMLEIMVKNKITSLKAIQEVTFDDYVYQPSLSTENNFVYLRDGKKTYKKL